jgi:hypothetical protein
MGQGECREPIAFFGISRLKGRIRLGFDER